MVEFQLPKLTTRVRFPSPLHIKGREQVPRHETLKILFFVSFLGFLTGCASMEEYKPMPSLHAETATALVAQKQGVYHKVASRADTLANCARLWS